MLRVNEANVKSMLNAEINCNAIFSMRNNIIIICTAMFDPIKNERFKLNLRLIHSSGHPFTKKQAVSHSIRLCFLFYILFVYVSARYF